jgi:hypothetical protein
MASISVLLLVVLSAYTVVKSVAGRLLNIKPNISNLKVEFNYKILNN